MPDLNQAPIPLPIQNVPALLVLDEHGPNVFISRHNQTNQSGTLYGGQVVAQATAAAMATIDGLTLHSLHGYFLRAGALDKTVTFTVERIRDGRRFSTRRVTASQNGKVIFVMIGSFFLSQRGYEHQSTMPDVPAPETLADLPTMLREAGIPMPASFTGKNTINAIEVRPAFTHDIRKPAPEPRLRYWGRVPTAAGVEDLCVQQQVLAYMSDYWLLTAPLLPHRLPFADHAFEIASLDHAMWFHRPVRADDWLLFDVESPNARNGVNLATGRIYDRHGVLVASVAQEALEAYRT